MSEATRFDPERNMLGNASSPYLRSHADNPVCWQQWSREALEYARKTDRIPLVSIGYSTCHWCHVMAAEAFSDDSVAAYLNEHFVPMKVDREERPDIDNYMMAFLVATRGQGGWPLNVFLSPHEEPFFALTYAPVEDRQGMLGFRSILQRVREFYREHRNEVGEFSLPTDPSKGPGAIENTPVDLAERGAFDYDVADQILSVEKAFDRSYGGFGNGPKFPPHTTLLWLLYAHDALQHVAEDSTSVRAMRSARTMLERTLDVMQSRGLHDHLAGGFYRYCVDAAWTIPHFEKMLYDQALLLWVYAAAAHALDRPDYADTARHLADVLERSFFDGTLFISAHDADTNHVEGATYTWTRAGIREALDEEEWRVFETAFVLPEEGNFEGRIHLTRSDEYSNVDAETLKRAEQKLRGARDRREQPFADRKRITGWNALAATALAYAGRYLASSECTARARHIGDALLREHYRDGTLLHTTLDDHLGTGEYLADYASVALLLTVLEEEWPEYRDSRREFVSRLDSFRLDGVWYESRRTDFRPVAADSFDQPVPSSLSVADLARARSAALDGTVYHRIEPGRPLAEDFHNLSVLFRSGLWHVVERPKPPDFRDMPLATIYVAAESERYCFAGACRPGTPPDLRRRSGPHII